MRVRTGRFRSVSPAGGRIDEMPDWITARSWLNPLMLPAFAALRGRRPVGPFVHPVRQGVRGFLFGSVLHGTQVFRSLRFHGRYFAPGLPATTMTSADSSSPSPGIIPRRGRSTGTARDEASPGKNVLFLRTTPCFTSDTELRTSLGCASSSMPSA
jgi:hypothetical protein